MFLPTLYKRSNTGKINQWVIEVEEDKYRTIAGFTDGKQTTSQWTQAYAMNEGRSNATTPEQQALKEAEAIFKKKKEGGFWENINDCDQKTMFEPMLANKWEDRKEKVEYPLFSQPKLDGIRCIAKADGLWSRNGKPIVSCPHIVHTLKPFFNKFPDLILDGELYCDKLANDFNKICSLVKKTKPREKDIDECASIIEYWIYDCPQKFDSDILPFTKRNASLKELFSNGKNQGIRIVATDIVNNEEELMQKYGEYVDQGYEGQMIRIDDKYENKRSNFLLKHKSFQDEEFEILDVCEGEGNKSGMAGYMIFERNGERFKSNIKADWATCKEWLDNKNDLIGKKATVQYFNLTPDKQVPRFPYVIKIDRESYE